LDVSSERSLDDDERRLRRFLAGDAAVHRQVERWAQEILLYRRLGLGREDVEDVVQEVVVNAWQAASRPDFQLRHGFRAFVRTLTLARGIDRVRRLRVRRAEPILDTLHDLAPNPAELAESRSETALLHRALEELDAKCREVIRLHYFEGWPYARIAARERRNEGTMRVRMFACIRTLRERMRRRSEAGAT
jgi:RNA polymerase sigma-70 factor (ECF subfamily)